LKTILSRPYEAVKYLVENGAELDALDIGDNTARGLHTFDLMNAVDP
jgi:hypothetical protein